MELRTSFKAVPSPQKVVYDIPVFGMGSCFAELLGDRLLLGKLDAWTNPFGIIYNPVSILNHLSWVLTGSRVSPDDVLQSQGLFFHYQTHSSINSASSDSLLGKIEKTQEGVLKTLASCSHIFLTWGTAYAYHRNLNQTIVANCHKQPAVLFTKRLLRMDEMMCSFDGFYNALRAINPSAAVVVTVSPVRHTKEGVPENQLSKSLLRVFCHQLTQEFEGVRYFPSYEWIIDDLRDYRFYKEDMIHPSKLAEDYVWGHFQETFFAPETLEKYHKILKIRSALAHRPFFPYGYEHEAFLRKLLAQMESMQPEVSFAEEIARVKAMLKEA